MKAIVTLTAILIFALGIRADVFNVLGTFRTIPAPNGYERVTQDMGDIHEYLTQATLDDDSIETVAYYIESSDAHNPPTVKAPNQTLGTKKI